MTIVPRRISARFVPVALALSVVVLPAAVAQQGTSLPDGRVKGYVPPPANLHLVDGHWTPYEPPAPPEDARVHVVVPGDCLWNLAAHYYGDPWLWPTIWDANRWVKWSHWIYPGDPLVIPPKPGEVPEKATLEYPRAVTEPPPEPEPETPPEAAPAGETAPAAPVLVPAVERQEMICVPQLFERFDPSPLRIAGREEPDKEMLATGDVVYLSAGRDMGIEPGTEFSILRPGEEVRHPARRKWSAVFVRRLGRLRVLTVQASSATAEILEACDAVSVGDYLVPWREKPVPMVERVPLARLATPYPGRLNGTVVVCHEPGDRLAGEGDLVGIDLGSRAGITAGDRILFWRPGENGGARRVLAQGVVLQVTAGGATVKVLESRSEVTIGDLAEVL